MNYKFATNDGLLTERKIVSISSKRQITIPQKYFQMIGFDTEAECIVRGDELILRPLKNNSGGEFADQILADLIAKGLSGDELLCEFRKIQSQIKPAANARICEADKAAEDESLYYTYGDVFGTNDV